MSYDWIETEWRRIASDIDGSEGPVFDRDGRLFVVSPSRSAVLQLTDENEPRVHADTGGRPAGLQAAADGTLWCADMALGLVHILADGTVKNVTEMRGCNDLALDDVGRIWFTAPAGSSLEQPDGEVFCRHSDGTIRRIDGGFAFPNGIAVSPDGRRLVVAETLTCELWSYDIADDGSVNSRQRFGLVPAEQGIGADGLDYDENSHLIAANWGGGTLDAFDTAGRLAKRMRLPFKSPSNLHLGGADGRDLIVTEHETKGVWRGRWPVAGIRLFTHRTP